MRCLIAALAGLFVPGALGQQKLHVPYVSASSLFQRVDAIPNKEKGKYEKTADFLLRTENAFRAATGGNPIYVLAEVKTSYNADRETLTIDVPCLDVERDFGDLSCLITVGSYHRGNHLTMCTLQCKDANQPVNRPEEVKSPVIEFTLKLTPRQAALCERNIRILLACELRKPVKYIYSEDVLSHASDLDRSYTASLQMHDFANAMRTVALEQFLSEQKFLMKSRYGGECMLDESSLGVTIRKAVLLNIASNTVLAVKIGQILTRVNIQH